MKPSTAIISVRHVIKIHTLLAKIKIIAVQSFGIDISMIEFLLPILSMNIPPVILPEKIIIKLNVFFSLVNVKTSILRNPFFRIRTRANWGARVDHAGRGRRASIVGINLYLTVIFMDRHWPVQHVSKDSLSFIMILVYVLP